MRRDKKAMAVFLAGTMLISSILLPASMEGKSKKPALNKKKITTTIGKTVKIKVKKAKGYKITWKSQKKKLATVKKAGKYAAKIKAKKSGTVKITAKVKKGSRKYKLTCKVKIKKGKTKATTTTPISTGTSVTKSSSASVSATPDASAVTTRTGSPVVETDSTSGQSTDIPASTLPEESAAPTDSTSAEPTDKGDVTPGIQPTGGTVVAPTDSGVTKPTDNPDVKPTDNTGVKPTDSTGTKPTDNTGVKPTDNTGGKPTDNTGVKPTDNTGVKPTDNTGTKPTASSETKPTGSGTLPTAGTVETAAPTDDPTSAVDGGELTLSKETFLLSACTEGDPVYNEDGSVTITIKGESGGGGIAFALDSAKTKVKLSNYEKVIFEVSAAEETALCFNYHPTNSYWDKKPLGYKTVSTSKELCSYDLSALDGNAMGFGVQYNPTDANSTRTVTIHSITLVPKAVVTAAPTPTKKATPTPIATLPSTAIQLALTEDMLCTSACVDGTPTYNEDGSVTVTLKNDSGGGGIGFYIDPSKANVDLSDFSQIKFDVTAVDQKTPLAFRYFVSSNFWDSGNGVISYADAEQGRATFTYELGEINSALGFGLRYNAHSSTGSRTVTIHSITLMPDEKDITEAMDYTSLAELASAHNLKMGTVMNVNKVADKKYKELTKHHFNSITAANEMKAYALLDQQASKDASDGMPKMNYTNADKIMDYAKENGIKVRGHVLVWDAGMSDWFFRVGYDSNNGYAKPDIVKQRVKSYIKDVMTHFETNYPGVIYCWDVVNEAVDPGNKADSSDARCIENNIFTERMGSDYVELSFQYTQEVLEELEKKGTVKDADAIKLYYNDFSTYASSKCKAICALVNSINKNGKLCDGVGMQCYIGGWTGGTSNTTPVTDDSPVQKNSMNESDITAIEAAIKNFGACGVEVQVTEMAVRNWSDSAEYKKKHAEFYGKLMTKLLELAQENENQFNQNKPLTAISIWGLYDDPDLPVTDYSYSMNGTRCGLFTETCGVKDSFKSVYEVLGGTVNGQ